MNEVATASDPLDLRFSTAELERRRDHLTTFIADQLEAAGASTGIIGLSGGIDSTLVSHLAVEALGQANVYGLVLPSRVNREQNMSDAEYVAAELLDIEYDVIGIEPIVEAVLDARPTPGRQETEEGTEEDSEEDSEEDTEEGTEEDSEEDTETLAIGNLRARIRAVYSYLEANQRDGLVLGTGNRTEAAVGYFTKYGDGAVDCHPIANLYKQQVRQLARHVGVPDELVEKTPTAGLWADQTDEAELGIEYDTLDSILVLHVDGPLSTEATARQLGIDTEVVERVQGLYERSEHKRTVPPGPTSIV